MEIDQGYNSVDIPSSPNFQKITVQREKVTDANIVLVAIIRHPSTIYIDNVMINIHKR